jgi:hypothetical protein
VINIQCQKCVWRFRGTLTCAAFPDGIPEEVLEGKIDHSKPYKGDHGFQYQPLIDPVSIEVMR